MTNILSSLKALLTELTLSPDERDRRDQERALAGATSLEEVEAIQRSWDRSSRNGQFTWVQR